jgi:hypothetical protein
MHKTQIATSDKFDVFKESYRKAWSKHAPVEWVAKNKTGKAIQYFETKKDAMFWLNKQGANHE